MSKEAPLPIIPQNLNDLKLLDIDSLELARQLTLVDSQLYRSIELIEFLDKTWNDEDSVRPANIKAMIKISNNVL